MEVFAFHLSTWVSAVAKKTQRQELLGSGFD
jgi:hypothetical protein